jgi:D-alanyl-D-alanine carboxypeptidase
MNAQENKQGNKESKASPASRYRPACPSWGGLLKIGRAFAGAAVLLLLFAVADGGVAAKDNDKDGKPAHATVKEDKASPAKRGKSGKAKSVDKSYAGPADAANPAPAVGNGAGAEVNSDAADKSKSGAAEASKPGAADGNQPGPDNNGKAGVVEEGKTGAIEVGKPSAIEAGRSGANNAAKPGAIEPGKPGTNDVSKPGAIEVGKSGADDAGKPIDPEKTGAVEGAKEVPKSSGPTEAGKSGTLETGPESKDAKSVDPSAKSVDPGGFGHFPISKAACASMEAQHVINPGMPVGCNRLNLVRFAYVDFEGRLHNDGEIVVMDAVASHVYRIFETLRQQGFPIKKARLMDQYGGNDDASMADDNTSGFNGRKITGGSSISMHAYGLAIDINPVQNPFVKRAGDKLAFSPPAGLGYANRFNGRPNKKNFAGMAETVIDVFANEGFTTWGGYWDDPIDYQHFQVSPGLAEQLVRLSPAQAAALFDKHVEQYRKCIGHDPSPPSRMKCLAAADLGPHSAIHARESDGSPIQAHGDSQPGTNSRSSLL